MRYQKKYRQKNKGKKPHYYALSKEQESLHILAFKRNMSEEQIIENLINEFYVKVCRCFRQFIILKLKLVKIQKQQCTLVKY
jgi:hypothetical protein